ncbi:type I-E CRISPR-associated protein Cas5/CasD [Streptomyces sp. NPDC058067]|uniref:type I-E CRISPR-associated protein Cas5/CasD n=1 Tax=Streptomyces sp. NPDC058067 TaxID=3346324 RepID=UPI0036EE435D
MTSPAPTPLAGGGLLLHLSGPLQSWGERSRFNERDTATGPTRSGLIGLFAAALGRRRDEPLSDLRALHFTVRFDRPGTRLRDFHTVGGGMPRHLTVATAEGKRRSGETGTLVSDRYYLQDASFTVAVTSDSPDLLQRCAHAIRYPKWPLYLGRRSCPPSGPVLLANVAKEPLKHLIRLPLARTPMRGHHRRPNQPALESVEFASDLPLAHLAETARVDFPALQIPDVLTGEAHDEPVSFSTLDRRYRSRIHYRTTLPLPADRCAGSGADYLSAITTYLQGEREALR